MSFSIDFDEVAWLAMQIIVKGSYRNLLAVAREPRQIDKRSGATVVRRAEMKRHRGLTIGQSASIHDNVAEVVQNNVCRQMIEALGGGFECMYAAAVADQR